jgi:hypothetical protein
MSDKAAPARLRVVSGGRVGERPGAPSADADGAAASAAPPAAEAAGRTSWSAVVLFLSGSAGGGALVAWLW